MIQHNIDRNDMLFIEPWSKIKYITEIDDDRVIYGDIGQLVKCQPERNSIFVASYNGDSGFWKTNQPNKYRFGSTFTTQLDAYEPHPRLRKIFSTNMNILDPRVVNMPYGMGGLLQHNVDKDVLCYARFSTWTSPNPRTKIKQWCEQQSYIHSEFSNSPGEQTQETYENFFINLSRAKFTICPPGNGPDTYRVWQALYSNCIPIVLDCPLYQSFSSDLPMLCVKDFAQINESLLHEVYEKYTSRSWNYDVLRASYYNKLIEKEKDLL